MYIVNKLSYSNKIKTITKQKEVIKMTVTRIGTLTEKHLNALTPQERFDMVYRLCNTKNLFTSGSTTQYDKMFDALKRGDYDFVVVALTLCSDSKEKNQYTLEHNVVRLLSVAAECWYHNKFGGAE